MRYATLLIKKIMRILLIITLLPLNTPIALADLTTPAWYDVNAINLAPDWHYRVPINVPAGATINSTIVVDVDFAAQLSALGVSGTLDLNSPRVVRSTGVISTIQEFTDSVYAGATDALNNNRGEVRFILQDAGAVTYYLYFDITDNGAKPANPQTPINGNFEVGATGTVTPLGWNAPTKANANMDAQMRPAETITVSNIPVIDSPKNTDGNPRTGQLSYLLGYRTSATLAGGNPGVTFTKTITVPATSPGNITVNWRPEGWDSIISNGSAYNNYDSIRITVAGTTTTTELVGSAVAQNYATRPSSPNFANTPASTTSSGYRQYNGYDCTTLGVHQQGMTVGCKTEPWWTYTASLAAFAGQTITLSFRFYSDGANDRTWFHIDDIEWSRVNATLGTPEAFGANITSPTVATTLTGGQTLSIIAQVDAQPTAAGTPVTADLFDNAGTLVSSGIILYNDGTHGDALANNNVWTNTTAYSIPAGFASGSNWRVRVYARDASTSTIGATAGLIHIPTLPNTPLSQANFYNIDDQLFTANVPLLTHLKMLSVLSDPFNNTINPKNIPEAVVQYTIRITNSGAGSVGNNSIVITDPVPVNATLFTGNVSGGAPYIYINGTPSSAISCPFIALNSLTDCIDFSNDGGITWGYTPNGAYDNAVTHIRFNTTGSMAATGGGNPYFELKFNVQVK